MYLASTSSYILSCAKSILVHGIEQDMSKDWYLDIENDFIVLYKGDSMLDRSALLGGKSKTNTHVDLTLGAVLKAEESGGDKLKVCWQMFPFLCFNH